jgi:hypothetical protein
MSVFISTVIVISLASIFGTIFNMVFFAVASYAKVHLLIQVVFRMILEVSYISLAGIYLGWENSTLVIVNLFVAVVAVAVNSRSLYFWYHGKKVKNG